MIGGASVPLATHEFAAQGSKRARRRTSLSLRLSPPYGRPVNHAQVAPATFKLNQNRFKQTLL